MSARERARGYVCGGVTRAREDNCIQSGPDQGEGVGLAGDEPASGRGR
jgi:hypothetical protein